jgi:glycine hydroxymethyltransferase
MTTRGFKEAEFVQIVDFIDRAIKVAADIQKSLPKEANKLKDWKAAIGDGSSHPKLVQLRRKSQLLLEDILYLPCLSSILNIILRK